ncbi:MAG: hypothetical protein IJW67_05690, partial [Blautia sp.]|nr:hypothetical protein [Blautia sp.]
SMKEIIAAYMRLFGAAVLPPKYVFGVWISANHWNTQADVEKQIRNLETYDYPASVLVLEAWSDEATFYIWNGASCEELPQDREIKLRDFDFSQSPYWQDPQGMIEKLHQKGIHLVLWQIPVYKDQPDQVLQNVKAAQAGTDQSVQDVKAAQAGTDQSVQDMKANQTGPDQSLQDMKAAQAGTVQPLQNLGNKAPDTEEKISAPVHQQLKQDRIHAIRNHLCVFREDGVPYQIPEGNWFAGSLIPDFTKPETRENWFQKRKYLLDMGVDGFKTDGGEFIYREDLKFYNGMSGAEAKNAYAQTYTESYTDFLGENHVLFSRAGFSGAHRTPIHWGGDQQSENRELKSVLQAGLSAAMTGIPFWSFDIAGFAGSLPTPDLYLRATMLACFSPVMQWHSEPDGGQFQELLPGGFEKNNERSPWNMARAWGRPELLDEIRFWHKLRMNLLPYLYSTAIFCCEESSPMMRPLVYEWQQKESIEATDEYLLGESLLIAPLLEENQRVRELWLPEGAWYGLFSRNRYDGGARILSEEAERFPVYIREGSLAAFSGSAREGLDIFTNTETLTMTDYHFLLAGKSGSGRFADEKHRLWIHWEDGEVSIREEEKNDQDLTITWEIINSENS